MVCFSSKKTPDWCCGHVLVPRSFSGLVDWRQTHRIDDPRPTLAFVQDRYLRLTAKQCRSRRKSPFVSFWRCTGRSITNKKKTLRRKTIDALVLLETTWLDMYIYIKKALWCGKRHFSLLFKKKKILRFHFWFLFERERGPRLAFHPRGNL